MSWIARHPLETNVLAALKRSPVVLLSGPRQCGKTTLAKHLAKHKKATYYDLEDPEISLQPQTLGLTLKSLRGLVVIDECQREPALFPLLRVLADRRPRPATFLLLGSASAELVRGASESLAGRIETIDMHGFSLSEAGASRHRRLWQRGGFPKSFLASSEHASYQWRQDFIRTHLERDLPALGIRIPATALRRFWTMLAHVQAQAWNASDLARSMSTQEPTVRRYLDILTGSFMVRQLQPWFPNVSKRLVKAPKVYFRDTGLLHTLLGLRSEQELLSYAKVGFSWEGFAIEEVIRHCEAERDAYFYGTHGGTELDLYITRGGRRYGFEMKFSDSPAPTKSMHMAINDLQLHQLWVVYPGERSFILTDKIQALPISKLNTLKL